MNPKTGEILAMASSPSYDPNLLSAHTGALRFWRITRLTSDEDSPSLTVRLRVTPIRRVRPSRLLMRWRALESSKYNASSVIPNPAQLPLPGTNISLPNYTGGQCGTRTQATIEWALAQSCNTPFAQIAMDLGQERIAKTAENFSYGQDLKIPLTVSKSSFPSDLTQSQLAQSAIGQYDVKTTPLQVAMTSAAIANGGVQMKPNLIRSVKTSNLSTLQEFSP